MITVFISRNIRLFTSFASSKTSASRTMVSNKAHLMDIFLEGVSAVQPRNLLKNAVRIEDNYLYVDGNIYEINKPCHVVGFGKAVLGMAVELEKLLGAALSGGIVTVPVEIFQTFKEIPELLPSKDSRIQFIEGARNNLPDINAYNGAFKIKNLIKDLKEDDILIVLISGGGSALLPLPKLPITLDEKTSLIQSLSKAGANIVELNIVRKKLSQLKGGGLALLAKPAKVISLILSDIVGDPLDFIASGPTVLNVDDAGETLNILRKFNLLDGLSDNIKTVLNKEDVKAQPNEFDWVNNVIIGNNKIACNAAAAYATNLGYQTVILTTSIAKDVEELSKWYARLVELIVNRSQTKLKEFLDIAARSNLSDIQSDEILKLNPDKAICILSAGEPTVVVKGSGRGGRNQELALRFSVEVNKLDIKTSDVSFLSAGTDGIDGPTDAAGAMGSSNLVNNAYLHDINPITFLDNNDSYSFYCDFNGADCLIKTGHTGTNVMDLHIITINTTKRH